jgi:hypothetical protein
MLPANETGQQIRFLPDLLRHEQAAILSHCRSFESTLPQACCCAPASGKGANVPYGARNAVWQMTHFFPQRRRHVIRSTLLLLALALAAPAAPAPFPRPNAPPRPPGRFHLVGDWHMCWGTVRYPITLTNAGDYLCEWCGTKFVGSWRVDSRGRLWITESGHAADPSSWRTYSIALAPVARTDDSGAFSGAVEVGAPGVQVRFEKRRVARQAIVQARGR